jgi:glucose/arabinose dehydrogenase
MKSLRFQSHAKGATDAKEFCLRNLRVLSVLSVRSFVLFHLTLGAFAFAAPEPAYRVENIPTPMGLAAKVGGLAFLPDGRLAACFQRGEVYLHDPVKKSWQLFAEGLHDPLGLVAFSSSEMVVMQRPELTRLRDTDGDGVADVYETICDTFGITGNYHEFAFGPLLDHDGNYLVGLNTASSLAGIHNELRGAFNPRGRAGRMYSCVPWRGWIVKITPNGQLTPFASGFRSPNGLGYDANGNLFVPDNQGDWIGSSTLHHVEPGKFHGHPASLVWQEGETREPQNIPLAELDARRTRPSVIFPQDLMANSPAQPLLDATGGKFGPFTGQLLLGEMNRARLLRVALEKVDGQFQGMCVPLLDDQGLRKGNNRLAFAPDGSLWVGQTDHGWAGDQGLQRVVWTGVMPFDVLTMHVTQNGFEVVLTRPVTEASATATDAWKITRYDYDYHAAYGSKQHDREAVPVTGMRLSPDRQRATIEFATLTAWRIYEFHLDALRTDDGTPIANPLICYTLNHLLENTPPPPLPGREVAAKDVGVESVK